MRPCNYYENWTRALETMRADPPTFVSTFSPPDFKIPMVIYIRSAFPNASGLAYSNIP